MLVHNPHELQNHTLINLQIVGPSLTIANLVNITTITMVYGTYNELVTGVYKPSYNV